MKTFLQQIIGYSLLLFVLNLFVGYWLKSYESTDLKKAGVFFSDLRWDGYQNLKENIDVLILGSSHAYRSYHPETLKAELPIDGAVFNFGSSAQSPVTSYFVLNEVLEKHQPKVVVMDLYMMVFTSNNQLDNGRYNFHRMAWGSNKNQFLLNGFSFSEKVELLLFPAYVYRSHLKQKLNKLFGRNYLPSGKGQYATNGFAYNQDTLTIEKLQYGNQFSKFETQLSDLTSKNLEYLKRVAAKCKQQNIPLLFLSSPMPELSVAQIKNYKEFSALFARMSSDLGVPFHDFNIERISEIKDTEHYYDDDHLNLAGAKMFSKMVGEKLKSITVKNPNG